MRRALGLGTGANAHTPQQRPEQARARHRFVQDGGVPVVMLNAKHEPETAALRERITALESSLENERHAAENVRRQLKEASDQVTALQTRLVHADLAHKDTLEQERQLRVTAQEALQEALANAPTRRRPAAPVVAPEPLPAPVSQPVSAQAPAAAPVAAPVIADAPAAPEPDGAALPDIDAQAPPVQKRGRGRPRSTTPPDPKPVRWWTPSYRTKPKS